LWSILVIQALRKLRQKEHKFEASLGYIVKHCQRKGRKEGRMEGKEGQRERRKKENI
jgi:hypothetical protein